MRKRTTSRAKETIKEATTKATEAVKETVEKTTVKASAVIEEAKDAAADIAKSENFLNNLSNASAAPFLVENGVGYDLNFFVTVFSCISTPFQSRARPSTK